MEKLKKAVYPLLCSAALVILSGAELYNMRPFGTGAFLALLLSSVPVYVTAPVYLVSQALLGAATVELWGYAALCVCGVITRLVCDRLGRRPPLFTLPLISAVGSCGFIYAALTGATTPLNVILSALLGVLFALVCIVFLRPVADYKLRYKLLETELVCGAAILAAAGLALIRPFAGSFSLAFAFAAAASLGGLRVSGTAAGVVAALSLGCGFALYRFDAALIAAAVFPAALAAVFNGGHRLLQAAAYLLGLTMAVYLFSVGDAYTLLSGLIGCALFAAVPAKKYRGLRSRLNASNFKQAAVSALSYERRQTAGRLSVAADIFSQMSRVMREAEGLEPDCDGYARQLTERVCSSCPYGAGCPCKDAALLSEMLKRAVEDGHTSVGGLPQPISENCRNIAQLISAANDFVGRSKEELAANRALEAASKLLSSQLSGAEGAMRSLAAGLNRQTNYDTEGAVRVAEELTYRGYCCSDALIERNDEGAVTATLAVREQGYDSLAGARALNKVYKLPFFAAGEQPCGQGFKLARYLSGAPLDVTFGVSQLSKDGSGVSGDTHAFTRIGAGGFMMALADGMGSGREANDISAAAVGLVENYYRAGFDSRFIMDSVNRFLNLKRGESFSAMDVLVLDLVGGKGDVIKIGSPATLIRRGGKVAEVGGGCLPLGAIDEITPYTAGIKIELDDVIVMVSDGVADAFRERELEGLLMSLDTLNPQTISRAVLDKAVVNLGHAPSDDMTVLCGRVFGRM